MLPYAIRTLLRCTVETYIVPGTTAGSQIMWLYLVSWKREVVTLCCGLTALTFLFLNDDFRDDADMTTPMASSETDH